MSFDTLRETELFRNLEPLHLAHLASLRMPLEIDAGEVVFRPGDEPRFLYVIRSGSVRISSLMPDGSEEALAILPAGTYFGELKLVDPSEPYAVLATVHTPTILDAFPLDELRDLLRADRDLAVSFLWNMLQTLARRLQATNDKFAVLAKLSSPL